MQVLHSPHLNVFKQHVNYSIWNKIFKQIAKLSIEELFPQAPVKPKEHQDCDARTLAESGLNG